MKIRWDIHDVQGLPCVIMMIVEDLEKISLQAGNDNYLNPGLYSLSGKTSCR